MVVKIQVYRILIVECKMKEVCKRSQEFLSYTLLQEAVPSYKWRLIEHKSLCSLSTQKAMSMNKTPSVLWAILHQWH